MRLFHLVKLPVVFARLKIYKPGGWEEDIGEANQTLRHKTLLRYHTAMRDRELILRSAFWSGRLTYRKWRGIVRRAPHTHTSILVQAFVHIPIDWLLKEIGRERFIKVWSELRKHLLRSPPPYRVALDAWDGVWGMLAVGDISYPVKREVAYLPKKRRELLRLIISNPGIITYELLDQKSNS